MQMAVTVQNHSEVFKVAVFSLSGITFHNFPCFPCAVGTLTRGITDYSGQKKILQNHKVAIFNLVLQQINSPLYSFCKISVVELQKHVTSKYESVHDK